MVYTKKYVDYRNKEDFKDTKGQHCGNCFYFKEENKCVMVEGRIDFDYWCVLWRPKR